MTNADRRLDRAVRMLPPADRERYVEEWRADLGAAAEGDRALTSRGALRMATHLRLRQGGRALLGQLGVPAAVFAWAVATAIGVAAFIFGGVVLVLGLIVFGAVIVLLSTAGVRTHWSHYLLLASLVIGTAAATFAWWTVGLAIDADDAFTDPPAVTDWTGTAIVVFLAAGLGVLISAVIAVVAENRRRSTSN
ncbi:hypothetical protein V6N00_08180 [Tersicoccus sp. MR15.9]|uniref:hypothetical protein n=1 Tax=Tersicoccus mangrovi TaxID=3121635 RepID=UPI002FE5766C